jgi:CBS domain-containing protein
MAGDWRTARPYRRSMETIRRSSVSDVMSVSLVVVRDYDTIWHAADRFAETRLHHLVVLGAEDEFVGVLDDHRVMAEWPLDTAAMHHRTIGELLRSGAGASAPIAPSILPDVSLRLAGLQMVDLRVDALAVVDDGGRVVGILTSSDLIRSLVEPAD